MADASGDIRKASPAHLTLQLLQVGQLMAKWAVPAVATNVHPSKPVNLLVARTEGYNPRVPYPNQVDCMGVELHLAAVVLSSQATDRH